MERHYTVKDETGEIRIITLDESRARQAVATHEGWTYEVCDGSATATEELTQ